LAESEWLVAGLLIGVMVGIPLGWILAQYVRPAHAQPAQASASVVFDRDEKGRITGIHYVPTAVKG